MSTLLHILKYPPGQGGMDALQRLHVEHGGAQEATLALLARPGATGAGGGPWTSWCSLRKRFRQQAAARPPQVSVYYNCWGADRLADLDPAVWRIGYLHSDFPQFEAYVRHYANFLNGFLCVSEGLAAKVRRLLPEFPSDQVWCAPIAGPECAASPAPVARECVIGYAGRLVRDQKRVDRLPALVRALDAAGLRGWRLEILGDGPARGELETALAGDARVSFLGWRDPNAMRQAMERWRYHVTVSDYEGLSISLIEAAAAGCISVYPKFGDDADSPDLPAGAAGFCLYPTGDMAAAATKIAAWERLAVDDPERAATVRGALKAFGDERTPGNYLQFWAGWRDGLLARAPGQTGERRRLQPGPWERLQPVWAYNGGYRRRIQGAA